MIAKQNEKEIGMIERVVTALEETDGSGVTYRDMARAAIEAMREPTEEMVGGLRLGDQHLSSYRDMIDAALAEGVR